MLFRSSFHGTSFFGIRIHSNILGNGAFDRSLSTFREFASAVTSSAININSIDINKNSAVDSSGKDAFTISVNKNSAIDSNSVLSYIKTIQYALSSVISSFGYPQKTASKVAQGSIDSIGAVRRSVGAVLTALVTSASSVARLFFPAPKPISGVIDISTLINVDINYGNLTTPITTTDYIIAIDTQPAIVSTITISGL